MRMADMESQERSWWARNWVWAVPAGCSIGCLGLVLLIGSFVGGVFLLVNHLFRSNDVFTEALERARSHPDVVEELGLPLEIGWMMSGSISVSGPSGEADLAVPISGSRKTGTLYIVAAKQAGSWTFERLELEVEGRVERIDLLEEQEDTLDVSLPETAPPGVASAAPS